ncbi:hypothetical protein JZ751_012617 [Albula glossodonta]|uniref:Uncharacterized protein n=1 Tax=Albula glossodonta TaxID=121402 RepID=A0A8T2NUX7_9TELE|nr:hypothetical protein JZ751_012617 [Albula glossodonta]
MKPIDSEQECESLYLELRSQPEEEPILPLHTSITLFLLSYCDCQSFRVFLVSAQVGSRQPWRGLVPEGLGATEVQQQDVPALVRSCRLPAALDRGGRYCRAGLAVVLRHIINRTCERDPTRSDVAALLGFKKTCLKACAEVSQWTRLCELSIPSAVEEFLHQPHEVDTEVPTAILHLERKLGEPVRVHNDDKIRRQKLQLQQKKNSNSQDAPAPEAVSQRDSEGLELRAALAKLSVEEVQTSATRGPSDIRKVKTTELPPLEHKSLQQHASSKLAQLPLLQRWYLRVQEVPRVCKAAEDCGIAFINPQALRPGPQEGAPLPSRAEPEPEKTQVAFIGGPRPTMTKLKEGGIMPVFSPHPCPSWTLDWEALPAAVNPTEERVLYMKPDDDCKSITLSQQL